MIYLLFNKVQLSVQRKGYRIHSNAGEIAKNLNTIIQGRLNCFIIEKVSYTAASRRRLRRYLTDALYRYYNRKSQRRSSLYGQEAYELLVARHEMIDVLKYRR